MAGIVEPGGYTRPLFGPVKDPSGRVWPSAKAYQDSLDSERDRQFQIEQYQNSRADATRAEQIDSQRYDSERADREQQLQADLALERSKTPGTTEYKLGEAQTRDNSNFNEGQKLSSLRSIVGMLGTPGSIGVPGAGGTGTDPYASADAATYGAAKERTGLAMQSALKGLRSALNSRGVRGGGIEAATTGNLFAAGQGELGATDRQMAEQGAGRAFTAGENAKNRAVQVLGQVLGMYGSMY